MSAAQLLNPKAESRVCIHTRPLNVCSDPIVETRRSLEGEYLSRRRLATGFILKLRTYRHAEDAGRWRGQYQAHKRWKCLAQRDANTKPHSCHDCKSCYGAG